MVIAVILHFTRPVSAVMASRMNVGGWLQGKTIKKTGANSSSHTRSSTPQQVQSTSTTVFGGGVKDASGRVSEFFSMDDQCPVCKSDRYLNPKLRLLPSSMLSFAGVSRV